MTTGFIYFIQAISGPIKIGHTNDPQRRYALFKVGHYEDLKLLGVLVGTLEDEKRIHRSVIESHIRGEWFKPTEQVMALVAQTATPPASPMPRSAGVALPHERDHIEKAIIANHGNLSRAAVVLGCSRRTLQNRMRALGMPRGKAGHPHHHVTANFTDEDLDALLASRTEPATEKRSPVSLAEYRAGLRAKAIERAKLKRNQ